MLSGFGSATAGPLSDSEVAGTNIYVLTFGVKGSGTNSLEGSGLERSLIFGNGGVNLRFMMGKRVARSKAAFIYHLQASGQRRWKRTTGVHPKSRPRNGRPSVR